MRYLVVEILTAIVFLFCWLRFGENSIGLALAYSALIAGFIVATFIDFEHFIIPDEITIGGAVAGVIFSVVVPQLHQVDSRAAALKESLIGVAVGAGVVYAVLRGGKLLFGRHKIEVPTDARVIFDETSLRLPDKTIPYEELFYRKSDFIGLHAKQLELPDRCYANIDVRLTPDDLFLGEERFDPATITRMEAVTTELVLPREAMGLGDVKFMAAIGAFLGWKAAIFSLMASAIIGSLVGIGAIAMRKQEWSGKIPYGPYIALAAVIWVFSPPSMQEAWRNHLGLMTQIFTRPPVLPRPL